MSAGPYEHTGAYRPGSMADAMAHVEQVVAGSTKLQATKWETYSLNGMLWVRVIGAQYEAHAWHVAVGGRAFGSHVDTHGVRRQMIIGTRISVEVIDDPHTRDESGQITDQSLDGV